MVCATGKAILAPPNWLFAPVWTFLYLTIAVSGWLVWCKAGFVGAMLPLTVFTIQLALNAAWTPIFFGLHRPDLAFLEIVLLWLTIVATIALFYAVHASQLGCCCPISLG